MVITLETAIQQFLDQARQLQAEPTPTAEAVLRRVIQDYRDLRIDGTLLDSDGDMLLLQWGSTFPLVTENPVDLRDTLDDNIAFEESERQYINLTRQVFVTREDDEFDNSGIHLSISLVYGPARGDEPSSNQWIDNPEKLKSDIETFRNVPFVKELLDEMPSRIVAIAQFCG